MGCSKLMRKTLLGEISFPPPPVKDEDMEEKAITERKENSAMAKMTPTQDPKTIFKNDFMKEKLNYYIFLVLLRLLFYV